MRVVLDWDGTVTERDTLDMLLSEFGRPLPEGSASFREVMEREMASPRLPLADASTGCSSTPASAPGSTSWPASTGGEIGNRQAPRGN